ncbi:hypothetical protein FQA39_LY00428 [Lamprigera yunnana]|nr:hypothetical protein FQA39_LY00428 [Lamprigera yunnana]
MGQCTSRKAAGAFAASAAATHNKTSMSQHKQLQSPDYDDNKVGTVKKSGNHTKGVATSFGFKRRPVTAPLITDNTNAARRLAKQEFIDRNGNNGDTNLLTSNAVPPGRTTPRLAPPRKEANASRVSRFGFRKPNVNRLNKVADLNNDDIDAVSYSTQSINSKINYKSTLQPRTRITNLDPNDNKARNNTYAQPQLQVNRYTLQSSQLPRPQLPVRVIESKTAKQLANNNRKAFRAMQPSEDYSSKEGSMTEDSGVGSHSSAGTCETDTLQGVELLDNSPTSVVNRKNLPPKIKHYEMVVSGKNFDLRDLDDNIESNVPLPQLPSAFQSNYNTGFVRERRLEYEKHIEQCKRKISLTSSEGFSDVEDQMYIQKSAQTNINNQPPKSFLKPKSKFSEESSIPSSDEHEWGYAGEAMADDFSYSFSSSDESKEKESLILNQSVFKPANLALQNLMNTSVAVSQHNEVKNVLLTIEDPKFAAVAAASNSSTLLEDETSPVDSLICSYSESDDIKQKFLNNDLKKDSASSSNSKDINEKLTLSPSSPGTPTNASNSLSLSDGKDYFDDEIADQPALVFDDTLSVTANEIVSVTQQNSENTSTLIDSTPKLKRKKLNVFEYSPLLLRKKTLLSSRTASMDTLSPCESITSDDLMLDFDQSQSSGLDDNLEKTLRRNSDFHSLDEALIKFEEPKISEQLHEWVKAAVPTMSKNPSKGLHHTSRILRSRASTPSSIPDSPHSIENRINSRTSHAVSRSPLRPPRPALNSPVGYESDDSIKIDRSSHGAMVQDVVQMKTLLITLKRVLNEQADEECLKKSETLNPFENQSTLKNGLFNGLSSEYAPSESEDGGNTRLELADLRRQILFLQGQLDDREQIVQDLKNQMNKLILDNETTKSAPASTISEVSTVNAATQTERVRPVSAGPSLLQVSPTDGTVGSLVSVNERKSRSSRTIEASCYQSYNSSTPKSLPKLWRQPGEPPSPQLYVSNVSTTSSIPRRANSRTRAPSTPS